MKEVSLDTSRLPVETATFVACLATILEMRPEDDPAARRPRRIPPRAGPSCRWLGGLALGLVPVVDPASFAWAGPWIARVRADGAAPRAVVMYGIPSGVAWDPSGVTETEGWAIEDGFVVAPLDVALAPPPRAAAPGGVRHGRGDLHRRRGRRPARLRSTPCARSPGAASKATGT